MSPTRLVLPSSARSQSQSWASVCAVTCASANVLAPGTAQKDSTLVEEVAIKAAVEPTVVEATVSANSLQMSVANTLNSLLMDNSSDGTDGVDASVEADVDEASLSKEMVLMTSQIDALIGQQIKLSACLPSGSTDVDMDLSQFESQCSEISAAIDNLEVEKLDIKQKVSLLIELQSAEVMKSMNAPVSPDSTLQELAGEVRRLQLRSQLAEMNSHFRLILNDWMLGVQDCSENGRQAILNNWPLAGRMLPFKDYSPADLALED